jgi:hypothetical protein
MTWTWAAWPWAVRTVAVLRRAELRKAFPPKARWEGVHAAAEVRRSSAEFGKAILTNQAAWPWLVVVPIAVVVQARSLGHFAVHLVPDR